jgi:hypothetical protein
MTGHCHPEKISVVLFALSVFFISSAAHPDSIVSSSRNNALLEQIGECEKGSQYGKADSLYGVLDEYGALKAGQIYKWTRCRELLNRYAGSVALYCRLLDADARFADAVFGRLYRLLEQAPPDSVRRALGAFELCALNRDGIDTFSVRMRIAGVYASHGCDSAELSVLAAASGPPERLLQRLMDMARERYAGRKYAAAVAPALIAYERAGGGRTKTGAADLLYQTYRALHRDDSALIWIARTDLSKENRKTEAAALFQRAGRLPEAQALIQALPPSFNRDTLELRHRLFSGDTRGARELARKMTAARRQYADESLLWKTRTLLYDGAFEELSALLDTVRPPASWSGAGILLDIRIMLKLLESSREALTVWSNVEYDLFSGRSARVLHRLSGQGLPSDCRVAVIVRYVKELLSQGDTAAATALFREQGGSVNAPEYLYLYAGHLLRTGGPEPAREALLRIIREYPDDVFSEKSRVLLAKIQCKKKQ